MTDPDYMAEIEFVAASCRPAAPITQVIASWKAFDDWMRTLGYDVFFEQSESFKEHGRMKIRELVKQLYATGIGSWEADIEQLRIKNQAYGGSWCTRGGTGAFHMLARKADRLITQMKKYNDDLATALAARDEGEMLADTIGDLRRYLILVEAWHEASC